MSLIESDDPLFFVVANAFMRFALDERNDRALEPENRVQPEKAENAEKQPFHKGADDVCRVAFFGIVRFWMRLVGRKMRVGVFVTRRAGLH